jgi:hypothetical protein
MERGSRRLKEGQEHVVRSKETSIRETMLAAFAAVNAKLCKNIWGVRLHRNLSRSRHAYTPRHPR